MQPWNYILSLLAFNWGAPEVPEYGQVVLDSEPLFTDYGAEILQIPANITALAKEFARNHTTEVCLFSSFELLEHAIYFLETFKHPNNFQTINNTHHTSKLFDEDVVGRVDFTRTYYGAEINSEYVFGLFAEIADADLQNVLGSTTSYELFEFTASCDQYAVGAVVNATFPSLGNKVIPVEIDVWIKLNEEKKIIYYDAQFRRWPQVLDLILRYSAAAATNTTAHNSTTPPTAVELKKVQEVLVNSICTAHDKYCKGDNSQFNKTEDCLTELMTKRFGEAWEGGRDTILCRSLHQNMIEYNPTLHCPHIGPTGGDMCLDDKNTTYNEFIRGYDKVFDGSGTWLVI